MKNAVFSFNTPNLGDDMQSLAAALMLPSVDAYVDRDALDLVRLDEPHRLIMNSWFAIKRYRAVPHHSLDPIYFGFCVGRDELLNSSWKAEWAKNGSIGCRDAQSVALMQLHGIQAHFTGCLTMWIGRRIEKPAKRSGVLFIDVPEEVERTIPPDILNRAERITNATKTGQSPKARFVAAARLLDKMRTAEMVVTKRLHAVLPCVGFETPALVFISDKLKDSRRFSGVDNFLTLARHGGATWCDPWKTPSVPSLPSSVEERFNRLAGQLGSDRTVWPSVEAFAETLPDLTRHKTSVVSRWMSGHLNVTKGLAISHGQ